MGIIPRFCTVFVIVVCVERPVYRGILCFASHTTYIYACATRFAVRGVRGVWLFDAHNSTDECDTMELTACELVWLVVGIIGHNKDVFLV